MTSPNPSSSSRRRSSSARVATALLLLLSLAVVAGGQTTRLVPSQYPTIQTAIAAALNGDSVLVAPGVYNETVNFLGKDLVVSSSAGAAATIIRGNYTGRVVTLGDTVPQTAVLDGFTVENGEGGILLDSNSATIRNCVVRNNVTTGDWGGGGLLLVCKPGFVAAPQVRDCVFSGNYSAQSGGGVFVDVHLGSSPTATCIPLFERCRFTGNYSAGTTGGTCSSSSPPCKHNGGGGVAVRRQATTATLSASFSDCEFSNNGTYGYGGALHCDRVGSVTLTRCRVQNNVSGGYSTGGIFASGGSFTFQGCLVAGNSSVSSSSAGIYLGAPSGVATSATIASCTIVDNVGGQGAGLSIGTNVSASLTNSIIWGNSPGNTSITPTLTPTYCNFGPGPVGGGPSNLSVDPLFVDRAGGDYHLSRSSPLIDVGDPFAGGSSALDVDGGPRTSGAQIDIGADEVPAASLTGSGEDLELHTWKATGGDPNGTSLTLAPGDLLFVRLKSAGGALVGSNPLVVGQPYTTGFPPMSPPGLPGVHLDGFMLQIVHGVTANGFLSGESLPVGGILLGYSVPPGLAGYSFRLQGFAISQLAANGAYAVTEAHDLDF